jgi:hypothetical protein
MLLLNINFDAVLPYTHALPRHKRNIFLYIFTFTTEFIERNKKAAVSPDGDTSGRKLSNFPADCNERSHGNPTLDIM